jgi:hypothetical protein
MNDYHSVGDKRGIVKTVDRKKNWLAKLKINCDKNYGICLFAGLLSLGFRPCLT